MMSKEALEGRGCVDQIFTLKQISEKAQEKKQSVCEFYREALWQVFRIYDSDSKFFGGMKSMYVDSLLLRRVKGEDWKSMQVRAVMVMNGEKGLECEVYV